MNRSYSFLNVAFLILLLPLISLVSSKCINARECPVITKYLEDKKNGAIDNSSIEVLKQAFCGSSGSEVMVNCEKIPPCYQPQNPNFCVKAKDCCVALRLVKMKLQYTSQIKSLMKKSICDSNDSELKVKCGSLLEVEELLLKTAGNDACVSPNGIKGRCIPFASCYLYYNKPVTPSYKDHLRRAVCNRDDRKVCCAKDENFEYVCGFNEDFVYRISGGTVTERNEFPWAVKLIYSDPGVVCGGTLINTQFVLTAAHCVINQTVVSVRFGDQTPIDVPVIGTKPHKNYRERPSNNDIALIKIERVEHQDNIKWICLPSITEGLPDKFIVVGSGFTEKGVLSQSQLKATLPNVDQSACQRVFKDFVENYNSIICAGGEAGVDSCRGDSGGPLMSEDKKFNWRLNGIVSGGATDCTKGNPGFYTRVDRFINWINLNMLEMLL